MTVLNSLRSDISSNKVLPSSAEELLEGKSSKISLPTLYRPLNQSSAKGSRPWLVISVIFCLFANYVIWDMAARKGSDETAPINVSAPVTPSSNVIATSAPRSITNVPAREEEPPRRAEPSPLSPPATSPETTAANDEAAQADVSLSKANELPQRAEATPPPSQSTSTGAMTSLAANDEPAEMNVWLSQTQEPPQPADVVPPSSQSTSMETTASLVADDEAAQANVSQSATQEPPQRAEVAPPSSQPTSIETTTSLATSDESAGVNDPLAAASPAPALPHNSSPPVSSALVLDNDEIASLLKRAKVCLTNGDLASARLLLSRAAEADSAEAAAELGATFDPFALQQRGVIGVRPDIASARKWYQRAAELGSTDATQQLAKLDSMR